MKVITYSENFLMAWLEPITSAVLIYGAKSDHLQRLKADPPPHPTDLTDRASRIIALGI